MFCCKYTAKMTESPRINCRNIKKDLPSREVTGISLSCVEYPKQYVCGNNCCERKGNAYAEEVAVFDLVALLSEYSDTRDIG